MKRNNITTESDSIAPISISKSHSVQSTGRNGSDPLVPSFVIETVGFENKNEEINLREYLKWVFRNKTIVAVVTILLLIAPAYYIFTIPMVYQAETKIQVDSENDANLSRMKASATTFDNRAYFNTQLKLLKNSRLIRNIIRDNNLDKNNDFLDEKFLDPGLIPNRSNKSPNSVRTKNEEKKESTFEEVNKVFDAERLNPFVEAIQGSLTVQPVLQAKQAVKDTRLISVKFKHPDPTISKLVANAIADELVAHNLRNKTDANSSEREYLSNNITNLKSQIRQAENQILRFGRQHQLPTVDGNQNTVVERLAGLNRQLLEAENERKIAEAKYKASVAPGTLEALADSGGKEIAEIDAKLDDLKRKRVELLVEVTQKHPDVLAIDQQITVLENTAKRKRKQAASNYKTGLNVNYRQAVAREKSIRNSYDRQWKKMLVQNGAAINYRSVQQELETNKKLLDEMQRREKESEMLTAKAPNNIRVIEYAITPTEPVSRKRLAYFGLAFLGSFSIGIAGALLRGYLTDPGPGVEEVKNPQRLPAMVSVPKIVGGDAAVAQELRYPRPSRLINEVKSRSNSNGNGTALSSLEKVFRQHQTVLQLSTDIRNAKTILVTSGRGEGQSKTSINIARNLADTGASVLLIDSNFYHPKIHELFDLYNSRGLSNLITDESFKQSMIDLITEVSEDLHVLPSGPMPFNCSERLGSSRMSELISSLEAAFDYVIVDAPPVLFFPDSSVMATNVDGILLVVNESADSLEELEQIRKFLKIAGARILGVVLGSGEE